jgi:hypothetical protein
MTAGFYKKENDTLFYAPNIIEGDGYVLVAQDKDQYEYPIDGWTWFDSEEEAKALLPVYEEPII